MLAVGLLTVLTWFIYSLYLDRVERRLAARKGLYRELVSELATRDRALLEPTIHQMKTLYDLDALEAVLEEQARTATGRPGWLLEVYDEMGLVDKYIDKLRTARKWRDRAFAAELLGRVGSAKAVPALLETVQATRSEDADVREIALRALARVADPAAVKPLIAALADAEAWLAPRIADILTRHGDVVVDPLIALLGDSARHPARAWAVNVLGEVGAQRAYPALVRGLEDPDDEVRGKSATALGRLGDQRAVGPLLDRLLADPAPFVRVRIASSLGHFGSPEVIDRLVQALRDPAWWVRIRSVEALEQIGSRAEGPLLMALNDGDPEIRARAAAALERFGVADTLARLIEGGGEDASRAFDALVILAGSGAPELLAELLQHPSSRVREAAVTAVHQAERRDLSGELVRIASSDADPALRTLSFEALRSLRAGQSLPAAVAGLTDPDHRARTAAIRLVGELGGPDVIELLRHQSMDSEPSVRAAAARALGALGAESAQPDFLRLLADPNATVREAAVLAAMEARLRPLLPSMVPLLLDPEGSVRLAAATAIGGLGDRSVVPALVRAFPEAPSDLRKAIAEAVSRLDVSAVPGLVELLLESPDVESKLAVTSTLGRLRSPGAVEALVRLSRGPEPSVRAASLQALGRSGRSAGVAVAALEEAVVAGLADADDAVRARAVDATAVLGLEGRGRTLVALLQDDPSAEVRERAALAIGLLRVPGGEEALIAACRRTEPPAVRAAAALAAGAFDPNSLVVRVLEMPDESAVRGLLRARRQSDPWFRLLGRRLSRARELELRALASPSAGEAQLLLADGMLGTFEAGERVKLIHGLRAFQGEEGLSALLRTVREDPSPEVRTAALTAVGELLDTEELLTTGSRALGDPSLMVRRAAVNLFSRVSPERSLPRLIRALREDDDPAVLAAVAELAEEHFGAFRDAMSAMPLEPAQAALVVRVSRYIHHPDLVELLAPFARSGAPTVREAVAQMWYDRPEAVDPEALAGLTADPVIWVRRAAAGANAVARRYDLLERLTEDPDASVRRQVAIALGRAAPVGKAGVAILERLGGDPEMAVRAAAYVARLLQGTPLPLPPGIDGKVAAEAVPEAADLPALRDTARTALAEERRLAAALALALMLDDVAREVARTDPVPSIRHRVSGALELAIPSSVGEGR